MTKGVKSIFALVIAFLLAAPFLPALAESTDLVFYHDFENVSGTQVIANAGENAVLANAYIESGIAGNAVRLTGPNSYVILPNNVTENLTDFTLSLWAKIENPATWQRLVDFGNNNTQYAFFGLSSTSDIRFGIKPGSSLGEQNVTMPGGVTRGEWVYYTFTQEGSTVTMYKNGQKQSTGTTSYFLKDLGKTYANYIGKSQFSADPYLSGLVDEVKLYGRALSQEEIIKDMLAGLSDEQKVKALRNLITIENLDNVKSDISLFTYDDGYAKVEWSSSDEETITPSGKVTRPQGAIPTMVTLNCTITAGSYKEELNFMATVKGTEDYDYTLYIDETQKGVDIDPGMIGLFFEDINFAADGGLYAELVNNRSFEAYDARSKIFVPGFAWSAYNGAIMQYKSETPLNPNNTTYLSLTTTGPNQGFENNCYKGFSTKAGQKFDFSVYAKSANYSGDIIVSILQGDVTASRITISNITNTWTKYEFEMTADKELTNAIVRITLTQPGTVDFDMVSLFPQDTFNNRKNGLRKDLVEKLRDLHPGFLRFPGGCIIEGYDLANRYQWKHTIGDVAERKQNWNRWQLHNTNDAASYAYCQTYGLGFYEYFLLCEDIGAKAVPVVNCGMACQYQTGQLASMDEVYSIYIQDALDLIEFANGDVNTTWGRIRAEMGHPEPFNLEYLGIGNEQWGEEFYKRYEAFQRVISEKYPEIKLVTTSGPSSDGTHFTNAWNWLKGKDENFAYVVDEHYYKSPQWFYDNINRYDDYDRGGFKVFAGEYAAHNSNTSNNMEAALSIAAYMTGLEKNADIVKMASYAPLFARVDATQWKPDLIWFDKDTSYGSPDYYVQYMYSNNKGTYTLKNRAVKSGGEKVFKGMAGVGTWETQAKFKDFKVTDNETGEILDTSVWTKDFNLKYHKHTPILCTASHTPETENHAGNLIDGRLDTRWATYVIGSYATVDLGEVKTVGMVSITFVPVSGRAYLYELQISQDGENFETIFKGQSRTNDSTPHFTLAGNKQARYIRLISNGNTQANNDWFNLYEIEIYDECDQDAEVMTASGTWTVDEEGALYQTSSLQGAFTHTGSVNWKNYTIETKAMKVSGREGFLIPFLYEDSSNYYMWNIGGWGNTATAIEKVSNGSKSTITPSEPVTIQSNRWYDIKIVVTNDEVMCYLDGQLIHKKTIRITEGPLYMTSSFDEETKDIIIKVVNSSNTIKEALIDINTGKYINPKAEVIELSCDDLNAQNSIQNPENVYPKTFAFEGAAKQFAYIFKPYSFSVIRIHTVDDSQIIKEVEAPTIVVRKNEELQLPKTLKATFEDGTEGEVEVTFAKIPSDFTRYAGTDTIEGKVKNSNKYVKLTVTVVEDYGSEILCGAEKLTAGGTVAVTFKKGLAESANCYIALFDKDNKLVAVKSARLSDEDEATLEMTMPENVEGYTFKALMWNDLQSPLCGALILK